MIPLFPMRTKPFVVAPSESLAYLLRSGILGRKHDYERSAADAIRVIELNPQCREAYQNRAVAYEALGRLDEAVSDYGGLLSLTGSVLRRG